MPVPLAPIAVTVVGACLAYWALAPSAQTSVGRGPGGGGGGRGGGGRGGGGRGGGAPMGGGGGHAPHAPMGGGGHAPHAPMGGGGGHHGGGWHGGGHGWHGGGHGWHGGHGRGGRGRRGAILADIQGGWGWWGGWWPYWWGYGDACLTSMPVDAQASVQALYDAGDVARLRAAAQNARDNGWWCAGNEIDAMAAGAVAIP